MRLWLSVMLVGCAPSYEQQLAQIDKRLGTLETRVAAADQHAMEASSAASTAATSAAAAASEAHGTANACGKTAPPLAPAPPVWSCAANCLEKYSCSSNGKNNVEWKPITATGATAAETFHALEKQCKDEIFVDGHCVDGKFQRMSATIVNACVRN